MSVRDHERSAAGGADRQGQATTSARKRAGRDLLVVTALTGVAFAQPVLDLLGNSPTTIQFRNVDGANVVVFAALLVLVPPIALWSLAEIARLVDRRAGRVVHLGTVAVLLTLVGLLVVKEVTSSSAAQVVVAVAVGILATWLYVRSEAARQWLRLLSAANLLFLAQFVLVSPAGDLIGTESTSVEPAAFAAEATGPDGDPASVVMLVLDELSTQSLLDDGQRIDPVRFPNLAAFADDATWYRRHSTVSPFTQSAVPALLDGKDPDGLPIMADHPDNLFTLLAGSHDLIVKESLTALCGFAECDDVADSATGPEWRLLLGDAVDVWRERVRPGPAGPTEVFDDFEEEVETVPGLDDLTDTERDDLDRFLATSVGAQPTRVTDFVAALEPSSEPFFAFLHLILPHQPWLAREDGTRYDLPGDTDNEPDVTAPWRARVTRQRHFLQAEYTDRLVGVVLEQLKQADEYDDALVVVVSDHGVAFEPGQSTRSITEDNLEQIAYSPLLIKAPGQAEGVVDDSAMLSIDVAPTIAEILGTTISWEVDGAVVGSPAIADRGGEKYIYSYTDAFSYEFLGIETFDDGPAFAEMVAGRFPTVAEGESRLAGLYEGQPGAELIGLRASILRDGGGRAAEVRERDELREPTKSELLAEVAGLVPSASPGDTVVVAVNGTVVGVSPLYENGAGPNQFVVLLPSGAMQESGNEIRLGLIEAGGTVPVELEPVGID